MARTVKQYRYYGSQNEKNQPSTIKLSDLSSGQVFFQQSGLVSIVQLGIQTVPGVRFYLNESADPIIIGNTGIYELNVDGLTDITSLSFDNKTIQQFDSLNGAYLIVDAIYEMEEE